MTPEQLRAVRVDDLVIKSDRRHDRGLDEALVASIRRHGLLQPIVVQPDGLGRYEVLAGRRRLRHAVAAGLHEVPVMIRGTSDGLERLMIEAEENAHRVDWSPVELADLCRELTEDHGWTQGQVADWLGSLLGRNVLQSQVSQYLKLLALTTEAKAAVSAGTFSFSWARELSRLNDRPELQRLLVAELLRELSAHGGAELSGRAIHNRVERLLMPAEEHAAGQMAAGAAAVGRIADSAEQADAAVRTADAAGRGGVRTAGTEASTVNVATAAQLPAAMDEGDPLVGLYLEQVREGLAYLAECEIPEELRGLAEEVMAIGERFGARLGEQDGR